MQYNLILLELYFKKYSAVETIYFPQFLFLQQNASIQFNMEYNRFSEAFTQQVLNGLILYLWLRCHFTLYCCIFEVVVIACELEFTVLPFTHTVGSGCGYNQL